jgi:hypothetical protein
LSYQGGQPGGHARRRIAPDSDRFVARRGAGDQLDGGLPYLGKLGDDPYQLRVSLTALGRSGDADQEPTRVGAKNADTRHTRPHHKLERQRIAAGAKPVGFADIAGRGRRRLLRFDRDLANRKPALRASRPEPRL